MSRDHEVELAPEYRISRLIKGGWQLAGGHGPVDDATSQGDMAAFAEAGITTFDCADIYSGVEERIGAFLRRQREAGASPTQIQVHTKFVPDLPALARLRPQDIEAGIDRSRRRLGVESLDLVQFHWWDYDVARYVQTGLVLAELQRQGKIRHLGVTNFDVPALRALLDAGVPIVAHQVQYSLVDRRPENGMAAYCQEKGIGLLAYGALLGGFLSEKWLDAPEPQPPLENRSLTKYRLIIGEFGGWEAFQGLLRAAKQVADRHGVGIATVGLRWVLDRPGVSAVIVGARHTRHIASTLAALTLALDDSDRDLLQAAIDTGHGPLGDTFSLERVKGSPHAAIMLYDLNARAAAEGR